MSVQQRLENISFFAGKKFTVTPLAGDASTRSYYRIFVEEETQSKSYIVCQEGETMAVQERSIYWQAFLTKHNIPVPQYFMADNDIIIQEDLGDRSLYKFFQEESEEKTMAKLKEAIDLLVKIHDTEPPVRDLPSFNREKLDWELDLSLNFYFKRYKKCSDVACKKLKEYFNELTSKLSSRQFLLLHRDYHSKNLMVSKKDGKLKLIDFQDAMLGIPQYDLASFLEDSYMTYPGDLKKELIDYYWDVSRKSHELYLTKESFLSDYSLVGVQRVIKALGSFTYLYYDKNKDGYLKYIPSAEQNLYDLLKCRNEMRELYRLIVNIYENK